MNNKKEIAFNKNFNIDIFFSIILFLLAVILLSDTEIPWKIGMVMSILSLIMLSITLLFSPYCYLFDKNGITLCYAFFQNERYLWKNIKSIENDILYTYKAVYSGNIFRLKGENEGKRRFYMKGYILKSFRTKKLLEKYWGKTITGYFLKINKPKHKHNITKH